MRSQLSCDKLDFRDVSMDRQVVSVKDIFWYLGSILKSDGVINEDVNHKIKAWCVKWQYVSDILCDKKNLK
jgi:hypothetical protein